MSLARRIKSAGIRGHAHFPSYGRGCQPANRNAETRRGRLDESPHYDSFGEFKYLLRSGDVHLPSVRQAEPLVNQARAFLDWVLGQKPCASDAHCGLDVVRVLEAAMRSMTSGGAACPVEADEPELCAAN